MQQDQAALMAARMREQIATLTGELEAAGPSGVTGLEVDLDRLAGAIHKLRRIRGLPLDDLDPGNRDLWSEPSEGGEPDT